MSNGIRVRQNNDKAIDMLAAQKQLYREASAINGVTIVLSVAMPVVLAILQEIFTEWSGIKVTSCVLSMAMMFLSLFLADIDKKKKLLAASIQQEFDVYVFDMPWDDKLFAPRKNYNTDIVTYSEKLFKDPAERNLLLDWYTSTVDEMPLLQGIFTCQKENVNWDLNLRKAYRTAICLVVGLLGSAIMGYGILINEPMQDLVYRLFIVSPILCWGINSFKALSENIDVLRELQEIYITEKEYTLDDLQVYQKKIFDSRRTAYKIPDTFYKRLRNYYEEREKRIAEKEL